VSLKTFIKKVGRAIDPTNANSKFGSVVGKALDAAGSIVGIPPGTISGGLKAAGAANASKPKPTPPPAPPPPGPLAATLADTMKQPTTWLGLAAVVALVVLLRRK